MEITRHYLHVVFLICVGRNVKFGFRILSIFLWPTAHVLVTSSILAKVLVVLHLKLDDRGHGELHISQWPKRLNTKKELRGGDLTG